MTSTGTAPDAPPSVEVARPRRGGQTFSDMARSLGLMVLVIVALLLLGPARTLVFPGSARMSPVDYGRQATAFAQQAGDALSPPVAPELLPGWRSNAASFTRATRHRGALLHVGWATPGSRYVGLDETSGDGAALIRKVLGARGTKVLATVPIKGISWQRRVSQRGEDAFTTTLRGVTAVVTGNGTPEQMRRLLEDLSPSAR